MPTLSEICKSINIEKDEDLINEYNESDYVPFIINRLYSLYPDTVLTANLINQYPDTKNLFQYKYYIYSVRKRKRFSPWLKYSLPKEVELVKEYYGISTKKAKEILPFISDDILKEIEVFLKEGGITND
jgi:hypothetical protein